jgi:hypothetical protein
MRKISWINTNLKVRIVNKKNKFYNNKVVIHDILDANNFCNKYILKFNFKLLLLKMVY